MSTVIQKWDEAKRDFRVNQRLRWGVFLIVVISAIYTILLIDDLGNSLRKDFDQFVLQAREINDIESLDVWQKRVERESDALSIKEQAVWVADSEALVRANIQSKIAEFTVASKLKSYNLKVGSFQDHEALNDVKIVRFEFSANYAEDDILDFMLMLESGTPVLKVVRLSLRKGKRSNSASMLISALYKPAKGV